MLADGYTHNTQWQTLAEQFNLHHRTLTDAVATHFGKVHSRSSNGKNVKQNATKIW